MAEQKTIPAGIQDPNHTAAHLTVAPYWSDPENGAVYVHKDLVNVVKPWEDEAHISPMKASERLGDVESWCIYVREYATDFVPNSGAPYLTWSASGLRAVIDYHTHRQWTAEHRFQRTPELNAWLGVCSHAVDHKAFVEFLEDHADDIRTPEAGELLNLIRTLKGAANATFESTVNPNGTMELAYSRSETVKGKVELPETITIGVPLLRGHVNADGTAGYALTVRIRVSVGSDGKLAFRLAIPAVERALETVYAEIVAKARDLLGDGFTLLRGAE